MIFYDRRVFEILLERREDLVVSFNLRLRAGNPEEIRNCTQGLPRTLTPDSGAPAHFSTPNHARVEFAEFLFSFFSYPLQTRAIAPAVKRCVYTGNA